MASTEIEPVKLRKTTNPAVENHQQWNSQTQFQSQPKPQSQSISQSGDILDHKPVNNQFQSFSKATVQTPSIASPTAPSTASNPKPIPASTGKPNFDFGDSISTGLAGRQGGLGVKTSDDTGNSRVGANPTQVLQDIQSFDKNKLNGSTVRLSSGISNDPSQLGVVENQIKYLTDNGAKVQLVGVSNNPPDKLPGLKGMNGELSALANKYKDKGVSFLGGFTPGSDGVHPASYDDLRGSVGIDTGVKNPINFVSKVEVPSKPAPVSSAAPVSGGAPVGSGGGKSIGSGASVGSSSGVSFGGGGSFFDEDALEKFLISLGISPEKAKAIVNQLKGQTDKSADGLVKAAGLEGQTITMDQATEGISKSTSNANGVQVPGNVKDWIDQASDALVKAGKPAMTAQEKSDMALLIQKESNGDPNAINLWDDNAKNGIPSKGLTQTIDSTFNAYKLPGHDQIYNPVDNIIAGFQYAKERYGGVSNTPGIVAMNKGGGYVGY